MTRNFLYSTMTFLSDAPLAQLDRALDFGSSGRGFESLRARQQKHGVTVCAVAPLSFDCEVIVKLTGAVRFGIHPMIELGWDSLWMIPSRYKPSETIFGTDLRSRRLSWRLGRRRGKTRCRRDFLPRCSHSLRPCNWKASPAGDRARCTDWPP